MSSPELGLDPQLAERLGELSDLRHTGHVLAWDQQVMMPPDGAAAREILIREARALHRPIGDERHDRVDARIDALDLRKVGGHDVDARHLAAVDQV